MGQKQQMIRANLGHTESVESTLSGAEGASNFIRPVLRGVKPSPSGAEGRQTLSVRC